VILFLLMVPFAFFGVDFYFRGGAADGSVATVGSDKITQQDYADALRVQTELMRRQMGRNCALVTRNSLALLCRSGGAD